jgi:hypothetical protein
VASSLKNGVEPTIETLCISNIRQKMKTYGGVDVYIHVFLTSTLVGGEWPASRPGRFASGETTPDAYWIGSWVGPRTGLEDVEKKINYKHQSSLLDRILNLFHPLVTSYLIHLSIVLPTPVHLFSKMFPHQNSVWIHCFSLHSNLLPIPSRLKNRTVFWGLDRGLIGINFVVFCAMNLLQDIACCYEIRR